MRHLRQLAFTTNEYERRIHELRKRMAVRGLDAVMINDPSNITYLTGHQTTGYGTFQALVVPLDNNPWMVTRLLEESNVITRTMIDLTRPYLDTEDPLEVMMQSFHQFHFTGKFLGIESRCFFLPHHYQEQIKTWSQNFSIIDCSGIVEEGRVVKSDEEVSFMNEIAKITERTMQAAIESVAAGVNENTIAAVAHHEMYNSGGEYPAVAPYITSGPRTLIGHATWEGRDVNKGECVFLELSACKKRYHAPMMRTVFVGDPPKELIQAEKMVKEALSACKDVMKPGTPVSHIDKACFQIFKGNSIGAALVTRVGYSIGIAYAPSWDEGHILSLTNKEQTPLEENMTFHLIPWLQLPEQLMVMGLSETVRVTPEGGKSFFKSDPALTIK